MRRTGLPALSVALVLAIAGCGSEARDSSAGDRPEQNAGAWRTWVLPSPDAVRVAPPPAPGSRAAEADAAGLRARRTTARTAQVTRWDAQPAMRPWLELAMELVSQRTKDPPSGSRAYALVSVAMYDATVAASHWRSVFKRRPPRGAAGLVPSASGPSYPSEHAAIAGAASRVIGYAFPEYPDARLENMAEEAADARVRAGASFPSDVRAGLRLGRAVGKAVVAHAKGDGADRRWDGKRPRGRGYWEPAPGSVARPVQPLAGSWGTWVLEPGRQLRPGPPPRFGSKDSVEDARDVMRVKEQLTPREKEIAKFWEGGEGTSLPPGVWNEVMLDYVAERKLSFPRAARVFALLNVAMADAGVASWDAKYAYWTLRPENTVRDLGLDRRWKPYLDTPSFPSYVSGHATYSSAAAEVLAHLFPEDEKLFRQKAQEAAMSRLYGGIHFRRDNEVGTRMGREIGRLVVERAKRNGAGR